MATTKKGMEAVIAKADAAGKSKRKPLMKRKGPGIAIMIALGKPKPEGMKEELDASKGAGMPKAQKIAALEEKIGYLKAELALLKGGEDESPEMDDEAEDDED